MTKRLKYSIMSILFLFCAVAFVLFGCLNSLSAEKTYAVICAEYDGDDALVDINITEGTVGAKKSKLVDIPYPVATLEHYFRYFVWDSLKTMVPLAETKKVE